MPFETELKLEVPEAGLGAIANLPWLKKLQAAPSRTEKLVSVYFDTRKETLKRHHLGLRVRHKDGKHLQTVKAGASSVDRQEWEREIPGTLPQRKPAHKTALKPFASKRNWKKLGPLFETDVERTSIPVHFRGASVAMALDKGRVTARGRELPISEVELELNDGKMSAIVELARRLADKAPLSLSLQSKAARGYALVHDEVASPVKAPALAVSASQSTKEGFATIALSCLEHVTSNRAAVLKGDAEGVHQMRVGLRRLRAAFSLFKEMLRDPETEKIKENLKWLSEQLGPARDLDVFMAKSVIPIQAKEGRRIPLKALKRELAAGRAQGIEKARKMAAGERYRRTVLETSFWALAGKWAEGDEAIARAIRMRPLADTAPAILKRRTKKVVKKLARLDEMDAQGRHKLRIAVKKLRYATGFFAALYAGGKVRKQRDAFAGRLKQLQSALGRLNDIHVHEEYARKQVGRTKKGGNDKSGLFGLGFVTGSENETVAGCLGAAVKAGKRFARQPHYWN